VNLIAFYLLLLRRRLDCWRCGGVVRGADLRAGPSASLRCKAAVFDDALLLWSVLACCGWRVDAGPGLTWHVSGRGYFVVARLLPARRDDT
jgi:hypothetical protein